MTLTTKRVLELRDEAQSRLGSGTGNFIEKRTDLILALASELLKTREALEPFAAVAEHDIGDSEADGDIFMPIGSLNNRVPLLTVGDLRRASAALPKDPDTWIRSR